MCSRCAKGSTSSSDRTKCETCSGKIILLYNRILLISVLFILSLLSGNTYSRDAGSPCYQCGYPTVPVADHTACTDTCAFTLGGYSYDISYLGQYLSKNIFMHNFVRLLPEMGP